MSVAKQDLFFIFNNLISGNFPLILFYKNCYFLLVSNRDIKFLDDVYGVIRLERDREAFLMNLRF